MNYKHGILNYKPTGLLYSAQYSPFCIVCVEKLRTENGISICFDVIKPKRAKIF